MTSVSNMAHFRSCAFPHKCFICVTGGGVDVGVSKSKPDFSSITGVISFLNIHQSPSPHYSGILIITFFSRRVHFLFVITVTCHGQRPVLINEVDRSILGARNPWSVGHSSRLLCLTSLLQ